MTPCAVDGHKAYLYHGGGLVLKLIPQPLCTLTFPYQQHSLPLPSTAKPLLLSSPGPSLSPLLTSKPSFSQSYQYHPASIPHQCHPLPSYFPHPIPLTLTLHYHPLSAIPPFPHAISFLYPYHLQRTQHPSTPYWGGRVTWLPVKGLAQKAAKCTLEMPHAAGRRS